MTFKEALLHSQLIIQKGKYETLKRAYSLQCKIGIIWMKKYCKLKVKKEV